MIQNIIGSADWESVKIGISVAGWNSMITDEMLEGAIDALNGKGIQEENIVVARCPGSYELPLTCKYLLEHIEGIHGVIAIGAVIRGDTPHFDFVCDAVNRGIMDLNMMYNKPVAFGVLTTDNVEQAIQRAGKEKGNKGSEAALALCDMIGLGNKLRRRGN